MPHGGPEARDEFDYDRWVQALATRGFLVFQPNFRGSEGYGVAFAESGYGKWGGRMEDDITDGVKQLIASGQVDPKRICIFGASYGGYAALIGGAQRPDLYQCVVSWAGISDLGAFMRFKRGGLFVGERSPSYDYWVKAIGDPDADKARLAQASAVTYAASYVPPVLLIHGNSDTNVPADQSREMDGALRAARKDVKLTLIKGEDHTDWDLDNEQKAIGQVIDFISAHIAPAKLTPTGVASDDSRRSLPQPHQTPAGSRKPSASLRRGVEPKRHGCRRQFSRRSCGATSRSACRRPAGPACGHFSVTVSITSWSMAILRPHSRWVSGGHLLVASRPILEPRPALRRGEVEIVDRRVLDHGDVARRVHAGGDRPHHVLPVARVDVVVHHDHPLGVHELAQVRPHAHHHPLGVAGIGLLHRHHGDAVGAALRRQPEIDDLGELLAQQRDEDLVQRLAQHRWARPAAGRCRWRDRSGRVRMVMAVTVKTGNCSTEL